jgi:hypothetical protein
LSPVTRSRSARRAREPDDVARDRARPFTWHAPPLHGGGVVDASQQLAGRRDDRIRVRVRDTPVLHRGNPSASTKPSSIGRRSGVHPASSRIRSTARSASSFRAVRARSHLIRSSKRRPLI